MRRPRRQFTLRWMIVAVAVIASVADFESMRRRSNEFRRRAHLHNAEIFAIEDEIPPDPEWEAYWFSDKDDRPMPRRRRFYPPGYDPPVEDDPPQIKEWRKSQAERLSFHETMSRKYERAAAFPWLAVETDPPQPK